MIVDSTLSAISNSQVFQFSFGIRTIQSLFSNLISLKTVLQGCSWGLTSAVISVAHISKEALVLWYVLHFFYFFLYDTVINKLNKISIFLRRFYVLYQANNRMEISISVCMLQYLRLGVYVSYKWVPYFCENQSIVS